MMWPTFSLIEEIESQQQYSNLPNKRTGMITEFWEKTLIDVLQLFLASEN